MAKHLRALRDPFVGLVVQQLYLHIRFGVAQNFFGSNPIFGAHRREIIVECFPLCLDGEVHKRLSGEGNGVLILGFAKYIDDQNTTIDFAKV